MVGAGTSGRCLSSWPREESSGLQLRHFQPPSRKVDLSLISQEEFVVMSDETVQSGWCCLEWVTAEANDVEIKSMVDLQRLNKRAAIASVKIEYPIVLKHQWTDYSDRLRRHCFIENDGAPCDWYAASAWRDEVIRTRLGLDCANVDYCMSRTLPCMCYLLKVTGNLTGYRNLTSFRHTSPSCMSPA